MDTKTTTYYTELLKKELMTALGCTEPGALAYASAQAAAILENFPEKISAVCSGNIIKNVKGVFVPNSGGLRGVDAAVILGAVIGDPAGKLNVLENATEEDRQKTRRLLDSDFCQCSLKEGEDNLYIEITASEGEHSSRVILQSAHTNIVYMEHNGAVLLDTRDSQKKEGQDGQEHLLNMEDIFQFADQGDLTPLQSLLEHQIEANCAIAQEGLDHNYGASVGRTILETEGNSVQVRAKAKAAAGSDARMGGCSMPVVVNSGSGNQGITVTLPVVEYARELTLSQEKLYRALVLSNLISIHIKRQIGTLSAFCGAVSAACGSGAAITYMNGGDLNEISSTIVNTLANVGGIVCDGAKASCAAKIASSLDAAIMAHNMSLRNRNFQAGEGFIAGDVEKTISNMGHIGREGMKATDVEILNLMLQNRVQAE